MIFHHWAPVCTTGGDGNPVASLGMHTKPHRFHEWITSWAPVTPLTNAHDHKATPRSHLPLTTSGCLGLDMFGEGGLKERIHWILSISKACAPDTLVVLALRQVPMSTRRRQEADDLSSLGTCLHHRWRWKTGCLLWGCTQNRTDLMNG